MRDDAVVCVHYGAGDPSWHAGGDWWIPSGKGCSDVPIRTISNNQLVRTSVHNRSWDWLFRVDWSDGDGGDDWWRCQWERRNGGGGGISSQNLSCLVGLSVTDCLSIHYIKICHETHDCYFIAPITRNLLGIQLYFLRKLPDQHESIPNQLVFLQLVLEPYMLQLFLRYPKYRCIKWLS